MSYEHTIASLLSQVLTAEGLDVTELGDLAATLEVPKDHKLGDFAFPCFRLAKLRRQAPPQIASSLLPALEALVATQPDLAGVGAAGPYLNFKVNKAALAAMLIPSILDGSFLATRPSAGEKVMIEYSQPNTHKAFHVGHTRNVALGDALVRIWRWCGYDVVASNYIGDEGAHIAKCLWYYRTQFQGEVPDHNLGEFLGELYTQATLLLDFKSLTRCPMPLVQIARVSAIEPIEDQAKVKKVQVTTGQGSFQVICGGIGYAVGDLVAYAHVGARVAGRQIAAVEKYGIHSVGMILSILELGLGDDKDQLYIFPPESTLGQDVAEFFRIPEALPEGVGVLAEMQRRGDGVAETLKLLEARDPEVEQLWRKTRDWSMNEFYQIYAWLDAQFDHYFFESEVGESGKKTCLEFLEKGLLVRSEGAVGADLSAFNLPFLLLVKSDGSGLYATKDIALAKEKFETFGIDRSVYVVDVSQSLHFQQVFKTLELMGYDRARNCYHLAYGMVKLPSGKMGSRYGNVILFSQLRDALDQKIKKDYLDAFRGDWPESEIDEAAKRISIATIRYGMTNQDNAKDIVFDMDEWTSQSGNTGPYMLYAYARSRSLLRKAGQFDASLADWSLLGAEQEERLINQIAEFPKVVDRARAEYRPQLLCIYLFQLARDFSRFYDNCPVLTAEPESLKVARILLIDAGSQVIQMGLALLGIQTLDRM